MDPRGKDDEDEIWIERVMMMNLSVCGLEPSVILQWISVFIIQMQRFYSFPCPMYTLLQDL
jgi:hypothetical protein